MVEEPASLKEIYDALGRSDEAIKKKPLHIEKINIFETWNHVKLGNMISVFGGIDTFVDKERERISGLKGIRSLGVADYYTIVYDDEQKASVLMRSGIVSKNKDVWHFLDTLDGAQKAFMEAVGKNFGNKVVKEDWTTRGNGSETDVILTGDYPLDSLIIDDVLGNDWKEQVLKVSYRGVDWKGRIFMKSSESGYKKILVIDKKEKEKFYLNVLKKVYSSDEKVDIESNGKTIEDYLAPYREVAQMIKQKRKNLVTKNNFNLYNFSESLLRLTLKEEVSKKIVDAQPFYESPYSEDNRMVYEIRDQDGVTIAYVSSVPGFLIKTEENPGDDLLGLSNEIENTIDKNYGLDKPVGSYYSGNYYKVKKRISRNTKPSVVTRGGDIVRMRIENSDIAMVDKNEVGRLAVKKAMQKQKTRKS